jgi:type VI secretion system protein ImpG
MLKDFYQEELGNLRELGSQFAKAYPALAPMLAAKGADPDVERLLEGVAFLSGLIRQRLAEGFPDLIQSLLQILYPQLLRPMPSFSMMRFRPVQGFAETVPVPKGTQLASIPVDGVSARFSTTCRLDMLPAMIHKVVVEQADNENAVVEIHLAAAAPLNKWWPDALSIHCAGDYTEASERRRVFLTRTGVIEAKSGGRFLRLGASALSSGGFSLAESTLTSDMSLFGYSLLQEYFALPHKFLFLNLKGLAPLAESDDSAAVLRFHLSGLAAPLPALKPEHFLLNVCPVVNIFPHPAHPITVTNRQNEYLLRPEDHEAEKISVFSISGVTAVTSNGETRPYLPFEKFARHTESQGVYSLRRQNSAISGLPEYYLSTLYHRGQEPPENETLSVNLLCSNHGITDFLRTGEISQPTDTSPAMAVFGNIIPPTRYSPPIDDDSQMWKMLSHLHVNLMPIVSAEALKEILTLYAIPGDADMSRKLSNQKRIEAICDISIEMDDYFIHGLPVRGNRITLTVDGGGFASRGDLFLFGEVLDYFFGLFHSINTYSRLFINEKNTNEIFQWPARLGLKRLL